jgi:streptomycin 6-kinase
VRGPRWSVRRWDVVDVPAVVREKARVAGADRWLADLDDLVGELCREWHLTPGPVLPGGTEALVLAVVTAAGDDAVLKVLVPRSGDAARHEITVLRLADGDGCPRLLEADEERGALLLERLGPQLAELDLPLEERLPILCAAAARIWRPVDDVDLPSGAAKGRWLVDHIRRLHAALPGACSERAVAHALDCAARRIAGHDPARAVLVHGDVHEWNALRAGDGFSLVDPDGLLADAEYDLGILLREDPEELLSGDPRERAMWVADLTGLDARVAWEWGVVERVSTGLLCAELGLQPVGGLMLEAADRIAGGYRDLTR